jgi:hypothetical protein
MAEDSSMGGGLLTSQMDIFGGSLVDDDFFGNFHAVAVPIGPVVAQVFLASSVGVRSHLFGPCEVFEGPHARCGLSRICDGVSVWASSLWSSLVIGLGILICVC